MIKFYNNDPQFPNKEKQKKQMTYYLEPSIIIHEGECNSDEENNVNKI